MTASKDLTERCIHLILSQWDFSLLPPLPLDSPLRPSSHPSIYFFKMPPLLLSLSQNTKFYSSSSQQMKPHLDCVHFHFFLSVEIALQGEPESNRKLIESDVLEFEFKLFDRQGNRESVDYVPLSLSPSCQLSDRFRHVSHYNDEWLRMSNVWIESESESVLHNISYNCRYKWVQFCKV